MRRFACLLAAALLILAACGDDDDDGGSPGAVTTVGTKEATPEVTAGEQGGEAPAPAEPELDEELTEIARAELEAGIEPGATYDVDSQALAEEVGVTPSCANFQFDFSWQVSDPYPPDGVDLAWQLDREGGPVEIASGPAGNQAIGCGLLHAENRGSTAITVAIKYAIGEIPE